MTHQPDMNPKTAAGGMNKVPLHLVPDSAIAHMAMAFADGGFKYRPFNFAVDAVSATVYIGAAERHLKSYTNGTNRTKDSGVHPLAAVMACCAILIDAETRGMLNDNRPPPYDYEALLDELAALLPAMRERDSTKFDLHDIP